MFLNDWLLAIIFLSSLLGLAMAFFWTTKVLNKNAGSREMIKISQAINQGANAYLKRQFKAISLIVIFLVVFLFLTAKSPYLGTGRAVAFLLGAGFSSLIGWIGMNLATRANARVCQAAQKSYREALELTFRSGAITGMLVVGLGLLGATLIYFVYRHQAAEVLIGFGFGGSLLALFMRVGGGIYTKAADVGADLVGKVEKGIPEDDPRNAAVIADLVGDNVGDCAGMAADLFESDEVTLVAAMILGGMTFGTKGILFPLAIKAVGIIASILGIFLVKVKENGKGMLAIQRGFGLAAGVSILGFFWLAQNYVHDLRFFAVTTIGILLAVAILFLTSYFTGDHSPVREITQSAQTGPATVILSGLTKGFESSVWAILVIGITILASFWIFQDPLQATYGIALAGMGMLSASGLIVAMDSYGPIADNAQGIAEMTHLKGKPLETLNQLDSIGNTTKATTKGFAIASAVIAATSLFSSFTADVQLSAINIGKPVVFVGLLLGGAVPFLFSSLTIQAVSRAAFQIVKEVRRQFKEIKGLMEGKAEPNYAQVVEICTGTAIQELITPALMAILIPLLVGLLLKQEALGAFLAGIILTGQLLAVFMANTGGAWDNAKKLIEAGLLGGKGSAAHKAAVIGDTVGDPLKDTSGPAINPLVKVINLVALLIAPLIVSHQKLTPQLWLLVIVTGSILFASIWLSKKRVVE